MIKITPSGLNQKQSRNDLAYEGLRNLRNAFRRDYVRAGEQLSDHVLAALLFHLAVRIISDKRPAYGKKDLYDASSELYKLLPNFLAEEICQALPMPDKDVFSQAELFYAKNDFSNLYKDIANIGFAYQIFSLAWRKRQALANVQSANKTIAREDLIAFTQLYTPSWVVDFLLANTVLPRAQNFVEAIDQKYRGWQIKEVAEPKALAAVEQLEELSLIDPACGAGQFLFSAFDLFFNLYTVNGCSAKQAIEKIFTNNLYGADLDKKALWVAGLGLLSQCLCKGDFVPRLRSNLIYVDSDNHQEEFLGSIDNSWPPEHPLKKQYQIVVTNPPYIGRKCMSRSMRAALKEQYPNSCADLSAAFINRCMQMLMPNGRLGVITQSALMAIPSYKALRSYLIDNYSFEILVNCGPGVFPLASGEKIDSLLMVMRAPVNEENEFINRNVKCIDLVSTRRSISKEYTSDKPADLLLGIIGGASYLGAKAQDIDQRDLRDRWQASTLVGLPRNFYMQLASMPKLDHLADIKQGLATTDNARFVRYHFDVEEEEIGLIWVPYVKGAGGERFASANPFVVKWADNGKEIKAAVNKAYPYLKGKTGWVVKNEQYYFRPGLCFSFINRSGLAVRKLPAGAIFDVASSAIFAASDDINFLLAYLNSAFAGLSAKVINRTINLQVGDLKKLPVFPFNKESKDRLSQLGYQCLLIKEEILQLEQKHIAEAHGLRLDTAPPYLLEAALKEYLDEYRRLNAELKRLQKEIDEQVLVGIEKLEVISIDEMVCLKNIVQIYADENETKSKLITEQCLAGRLLIEYIASLLTKKNKLNGSHFESVVLASSLGLPSDTESWLEKKLEQSWQEILYRNGVVELNKLASQVSRYFSFLLKKRKLLVFVSARAVRKLFKMDILSRDLLEDKMQVVIDSESHESMREAMEELVGIFNILKKQLSQIEDWTSRDLFTALNKIVRQ